MATGGIVPPLDVTEDRHPGLGLRCEPAACQQLAFQGCEEALAHGVIVGVTNRSHGWAHTGFPAAAAERQRCVLGGINWSSQHNREECCDGRETAVGSSVTGQVEVARAAGDGATRGSAALVGADSGLEVERVPRD